jgi:hypothetical protein
MGREPPSHQRLVALAGVYVCIFIDVLIVSHNDRFALVLVVLKRLVGGKYLGGGGQRLLLTVIEKESHSRFIGGFRGDNALLVSAAINVHEYQWFIFGVVFLTTFREITRAHFLIALAAFQPCGAVDFVDFN